MPQASFHFPKGFLWGTATAAHQVEGQNQNNNWAAWEAIPGKIRNGEKAGLACDWWAGGRWKEDFDRAAEGGQNTHRLSVEWSRIQPAPDRWDEHALDYYREMMRGLRERGLKPLVTLHHFTDPLWIYDAGGWENDETPRRFASFVRKTVEALQEYVDFWVTVNEPNVYAAVAYIEGVFPPGKKDIHAGVKVLANLLRGHAEAYRIIHEIQPWASVGIAPQYRPCVPAHAWLPPDRWAARLYFDFFTGSVPRALSTGKLHALVWNERLPEVKGTQDFIGFNYYTTDQVFFDLRNAGNVFINLSLPPAAEKSESGFLANTPAGLYDMLHWASKSNLPIYITENGVEDSKDALRPRYLAEHLHQLWRAVNNSWRVKGYYHWTLVDNFEWERAWSQRFGLWALNEKTQARIKRPSADLYAAVCRENRLSSEMVEKYAAQSFDKLFPV